MPSLENIEKFKSVLNQLGDEPGILEERGERLEDVPVPEEGLPDDLSALLEDVAAELGVPESEEEGELDQLPADFAGEDTGDAGDVTSGFGDEAILDELADVLEDTGEEGPAPEEDAAPSGEQPEPDDFTIPEGLFEEDETPEEGQFEEEPPEVPDMDILGDEETETGFEEAGENEFALSEELQEESAGEVGEVGEEVGLPEELQEGLEEEEPPGEESAVDEFSLPEEMGDEAGGEEEFAEEPAEEFAEEEFSLPEEPEEAGTEAGIEVDEFALPDMDIPDEVEIDTEAGAETGGEEDFELPGEISLSEPGGEEEAGDDFELPEDLKFSEEEELDTLGEDDLGTEGFSLGNISEDFGVLEDTEDEETVEAVPAVSGFVPESEQDEDFKLYDEDFRSVQQTLGTLPRNLKIAIEELIGEKGLGGKDLRKLLHLLIGGASPKELADATGRILGKKIKIPDQYEKRTGLELEEEKGTFAYAFRHNILPILRVAGIAAVVIGLLSFVGYRFVYRPLHAQKLYKQGYQEILNANYTEANDYFDRGLAEWQRKDWFFRYAEAFIEEREYIRAEDKYQQLLKYYPEDRAGIFDYAWLESKTLGKYEKAEELYNIILDKDIYDYEALLALGDNYMRWADEVPDRYEDARFTYATLIQQYGHLDDLELRMLDYFMRTDQLSEVVRLKDQFQANPGAKIDPLIYAKLGGYLVSRNQLDDVRDILFRVLDVDDTLPEAHFYLARYFNKIEEYPEEEKAIRNVLLNLKDVPSLGPDRLSMLIRTYNRNGEILMGKEEYLSAEESFLEAVKLYEDGRNRKILEQSPEFGRIYANIGDIYYYQNNAYDTALQQYIKAEQNGYHSQEMYYKKGFIYYAGEDFREALMEFYQASEGFSTNRNLMFATANTLFKLRNYYSAEGYYFDLLATLEQERLSIPYLLPDERPEHRGLIELLIKGYNNLGVNQYYLADRSGRRDVMYSSALVNLTKSAQLVDAYTREPIGLGRSNASSLAWLNQRGMLYPTSGFEPQIYTEIPKDMDDFLF